MSRLLKCLCIYFIMFSKYYSLFVMMSYWIVLWFVKNLSALLSLYRYLQYICQCLRNNSPFTHPSVPPFIETLDIYRFQSSNYFSLSLSILHVHTWSGRTTKNHNLKNWNPEPTHYAYIYQTNWNPMSTFSEIHIRPCKLTLGIANILRLKGWWNDGIVEW